MWRIRKLTIGPSSASPTMRQVMVDVFDDESLDTESVVFLLSKTNAAIGDEIRNALNTATPTLTPNDWEVL